MVWLTFIMVRQISVIVMYWLKVQIMLMGIGPMVRPVSVIIVVCWFVVSVMFIIANLMMWYIIVVVMHRLMVTFFMLVMSVVVKCRMNSIVHIMMRGLNRVVRIVMNRLNHDSLMVCLWVDVIICLIVSWVL